MRIEQLEGKELYRTRPLYQSIFHDTELFTDFFYRKAEKDGKAIVCMDGEEIVSEVFLFPRLLSCNDSMAEAVYLYGVATKEEYRGRGMMKKLMEKALAEAKCANADFAYLIPENPEIYKKLGFRLIKERKEKIYQLSVKEAKMMLKFNLEPLTEANFKEDIYQEINSLENEIRTGKELMPFRDREYFKERIVRAGIEGGGVYLLRKRNDYSIAGIIMTSEEIGEIVIEDIVGDEEKKEGFIKDFMRWKGMAGMKEEIFPVMVAEIKEGIGIMDDMDIQINDVL